MFKGTRRGTRVLLVSALAGGLLSLAPITAAHATTNPTPVPLSLVNGWRSAQIAWQTGVPGVVLDDNGIVHLSGAILHGASNTLAFTLPVGDRPASYVYLTTYTFQGTQGSLRIQPDGGVYPFGSNVTTFTDLASLSFPAASNSLSFNALTPSNSWVSADPTYSSGNPAAAKDDEGIVHLSGSLLGGTTITVGFVLPIHYRPAKSIYLNVYTHDGTVGYILIEPNGNTTIVGANAMDFTSLAGVTFRANNTILQTHGLTLQNGWTAGGYGSGKATVTRDDFGFVHLNGALSNPSDGSPAFVLPKADWPPHTLYLTTYTFFGAAGAVQINTDGSVILYGQPTGTTPPSTDDLYTALDNLTFESRG